MPLKAKVMVNYLQPRARGPSEADMAREREAARERQLQFMMLKTQEENRIREEEMRMKEKLIRRGVKETVKAIRKGGKG